MTLHVPRFPLPLNPLIAGARVRARRRRLIAATVLTLLAGGAIGAAVTVGSPHGSGASGGPTNPHDITAQNASDAVARGRLLVSGVRWTAYTYTSPLGRCLEVAARSGSVGGCGSRRSFTWGLGGLQVGRIWYAVANGFAPAAAASVRLELANGSMVPPAQTYVHNGVWFGVYAATATAAARRDDVTRIELLDRNGNVVRVATPPSISAYVRAARQVRRSGRG